MSLSGYRQLAAFLGRMVLYEGIVLLGLRTVCHFSPWSVFCCRLCLPSSSMVGLPSNGFTVVFLSGLKKFPGGTLEMQVNGFGKEGGRGKSALLLRCSVPLLTEAREAAGAVGPLCSNPSHAPH